MTIVELEAELLKLDLSERARLPAVLLKSIDQPSESEIEQLWIKEAMRRDAEMDVHPVSPRTIEDVMSELGADLHARRNK